MRTFLLITVTVFASQAFSQDSAHEPAMLEVTSAGQVRSLDGSDQLTVRFWLQQLMLSALYRNVIQDSSLKEWQQRLSARSRIYCRYSSAATLAIPEKRTLTFDEVLLPLPSDHYPDYIFLKRGQHVLRLGKYDPWVLYKLTSESGFELYPNLSAVQRGLF